MPRSPRFQLRPDLSIVIGDQDVCLMDTKWKLLDENLRGTRDHYRLSQSDLYQVFAYGQKYLAGEGELMLIYPAHSRFEVPLDPFLFTETLRLWVVPFDIDRGELVGGSWEPCVTGFVTDRGGER